MTEPHLLTLAELVAAASAQLAAEGVDPGNGQVSPRVDERTLRYYATLGLLDRQVARRGRVAVYGERHVAQAVAVKRLQAAGWPLADIQRRLAAVSTDDLRTVRADEPPPVTRVTQATTTAPSREEFWAQPPVDAGFQPPAPARMPQRDSPTWHAAALAGVALPGGAVLLLPQSGGRTPSHQDATALADAAAPLLAEAARRGLLPALQPTDRSHETEGEPR